jgi:hypothetical protein
MANSIVAVPAGGVKQNAESLMPATVSTTLQPAPLIKKAFQ